ncbi:hypothetical protein D3C73_1289320 [compost metagenome]
MTSAPRSASVCVAQGPARTRDRSSTRTLFRGARETARGLSVIRILHQRRNGYSRWVKAGAGADASWRVAWRLARVAIEDGASSACLRGSRGESNPIYGVQDGLAPGVQDFPALVEQGAARIDASHCRRGSRAYMIEAAVHDFRQRIEFIAGIRREASPKVVVSPVDEF